jgi:hypothetical protein
MALVALLAGLGAYSLARRPRVDPVGVFTGGDPLLPADGVVDAADFIGTVEETFRPAYRVTDPDPIYLALWGRLRDLAGCLDRVVTPLIEGHPLWATVAGGAAVLAAIWAF